MKNPIAAKAGSGIGRSQTSGRRGNLGGESYCDFSLLEVTVNMTTERIQELAGILNSKEQLVASAGKLAKLQLSEAQKLLGSDKSEIHNATGNAYKLAQLIAINLGLLDLVTTRQ